jgi:hypothetical protein
MRVKESASKLGKKITRSIRAIDDSAKNKPWKFIAGCAAGGAAIGYLFGRRRKNKKFFAFIIRKRCSCPQAGAA